MYRIYYGDGSTYDGPPVDAPKWNVQCIVQPRKSVGREILRYFDYFLHYPTGWIGVVGADALVEQLAHNVQQIDAVLVGRMIDPDQFSHIYLQASTDPDFPRKSASHKGETP